MYGLEWNYFLDDHDRRKVQDVRNKANCRQKNNLAALFSLSMDSMEDVHKCMAQGLAAGGIEPTEMRDYGFMQQRTIEDFDGHTWEVFYMDMTQFPGE